MTLAKELEDHIRVLTEFERDYRRYIEAQMAGTQDDALRTQLLRRSSRAGRAMQAAGVKPTLIPPPMFGGPLVEDFGSQVFAHETQTYGSGPDPFTTARMLLDVMGQARGSLEDKLEQARREPEKAPPPVRQRRAKPATSRSESAWYHNPWVIAVGGGVIATVGGGVILALVL